MKTKSLSSLGEFARFSFKTYQDLIHTALMENDRETVETVAEELRRSLNQVSENKPMLQVRISGLKFQLEQPENAGDAELLAALHAAEERLDLFNNLASAKSQIFFGLAAHALDLYVATQAHEKGVIAKHLIGYLPTDMQQLVKLYSSISDEHASDVWGWHWWDIRLDGEVHAIDNTTRPNRLFIVRALESLALSGGQVNPIPKMSEDNLFAFAVNNPVGVPTTLDNVVQQHERYAEILRNEEFEQVQTLRTLMENIRAEGEREREDRLRQASLDVDKIEKFKRNVVEAFDEHSNLRAIVGHYSRVTQEPEEAAPAGLRSWGYNQMDEKGAFIAEWYVNYGSWGEAYGRGLAQAETARAFQDMLEAVPAREVSTNSLIEELTTAHGARHWRKPVILQTMRGTFEYGGIRNREHFVPKYSQDIPKIPERDLDGFIGVIKLGNAHVPVFDLFVQSEVARNKVLLTDLKEFVEWQRFPATDEIETREDLYDGLFIKVTDLNADDARRNKILGEAPEWLRNQGAPADQEAYLRTRVVVQVYDRFLLRIRDRTAAAVIGLKKDGSQ